MNTIRHYIDLLDESVSLSSTLNAIIADIGQPVALVYETLAQMAERFYNSKGTLKGFAMVAGGAGSRWYNSFYFNRLQAELYDLVKYQPAHTAELKQFLRNNFDSFSDISNSLPEALVAVANKMKNQELAAAANKWIQARNRYQAHLSKLKGEKVVDDEPTPAPKTSQAAIGQQAALADQIVADVLRNLPKNVAGDIRNAIAKMPNKLQALQQELQKRNIKM